jgi:hypothetical protein
MTNQQGDYSETLLERIVQYEVEQQALFDADEVPTDLLDEVITEGAWDRILGQAAPTEPDLEIKPTEATRRRFWRSEVDEHDRLSLEASASKGLVGKGFQWGLGLGLGFLVAETIFAIIVVVILKLAFEL